MPIPSTLTQAYDTVLSSTWFNLWKSGAVEDNIASSNAFLFKLIKSGNYTRNAEGNRMQVNLRYAIQNGDAYSGYDDLDTTPVDGHTAAFFDWGQWAVPFGFSGKERRENAATKTQIFDLVKAKTEQAMDGIHEGFARALIQGNGPNTATAITTAFTSVRNGAVFIDPLFKLVAYDPTASVAVGNINQSTYSWWRNQLFNSISTTFAGFFKELDRLRNLTLKYPGGAPDLHYCDQFVSELYIAAMRKDNRYLDTKKADIPFDNVTFHGQPVTWDQWCPDVQNGTITGIPVASSGTWAMFNTKYFQIKTFLDFETKPPVEPENQDAKVGQILWHGGIGVSNRRKHGVMGGIDTAITS